MGALKSEESGPENQTLTLNLRLLVSFGAQADRPTEILASQMMVASKIAQPRDTGSQPAAKCVMMRLLIADDHPFSPI
jgi:hypothetical protein